VGVAGLGDPQAVEAEQAHQRVDVAAVVSSGGQQIGQLVRFSHGCGTRVAVRATHAGDRVADDEASSSSQRNQELRVEMRRYSVPADGGEDCASSSRGYTSRWVRRRPRKGCSWWAAQKVNQQSRSLR